MPHFTAEEKSAWPGKQPCLSFKWEEKVVKVGYAWKHEQNCKYAISRITGGDQSLSSQEHFGLAEEVPEEILIFKRQVNVTISQDQVCWPEQKCPYFHSERLLNGLLIEGSSDQKQKGKKKQESD